MTPPVDRFDRGTVTWMGAAHFIHDTYPAFVGVLLPVLITRFDLSLAFAGVLASSIRWTSLLQPIAGHLTDHHDARRFIVLASIVTAVSISLIAVAPSVALILLLLLVAGVSHSLFHPAAASVVTRVAGDRWGKGLAIFMTGGELGRAIGPLYIAAALTIVGVDGAWVVAIPGILVALLLARRVRALDPARHRDPPARLRSALGARRRPITVLGLAVALRSVGNTVFLTFLPTLLVGRGTDLLYAGGAIAAYELGAAGGALLGGTVSDRAGRRTVLGLSFIVGLPLMVAALSLPAGPVQLLTLVMAGATLLSAMPVQLATMHEMLPDNRGLATGLVYFTGTVGAILALVVLGGVADAIGLVAAMLVGVGVAAVGLVAVLLLPGGTAHRATVARPAETLGTDPTELAARSRRYP